MANLYGRWAINGVYSVPFVYNAGFVPDFIVTSYEFVPPGDDLDTRVTFLDPLLPGTYLGWGRLSSYSNWAFWGGDNVDSGFESVYYDINNFKLEYPSATQLVVDLRAFWYDIPTTIPVVLSVTAYKGGAMTLDNYLYQNLTATSSRVYETYSKTITLNIAGSTTDGERLAVMAVDLATGNISILSDYS